MKNVTAYLFLGASLVTPLLAFAHDGVDDGDDVVAVPEPGQRTAVLVGVVVVVLCLAGFMWYAHRKNLPPPPPNA